MIVTSADRLPAFFQYSKTAEASICSSDGKKRSDAADESRKLMCRYVSRPSK